VAGAGPASLSVSLRLLLSVVAFGGVSCRGGGLRRWPELCPRILDLSRVRPDPEVGFCGGGQRPPPQKPVPLHCKSPPRPLWRLL